MTDPDAVKNEPEEVPPPQPPRPEGRAQMSQVEADELYARQLAEHYDNVGAYEARVSNRTRNAGQPQGWEGDEREHSFIDDDLPVIRENLRKGFLDTQTKVNGWITGLRKKIEDSFDESEETTRDTASLPVVRARRVAEVVITIAMTRIPKCSATTLQESDCPLMDVRLPLRNYLKT